MKNFIKIILAGFLILNLFSPEKAKAQLDSSLFYVNDNIFCQVPATAEFSVGCYNSLYDTIYCSIDFGDGQTIQYSSYNYNINDTINHVYASPGNYVIINTITDELGHVYFDSLSILVSNACGTVSGNLFRDDNNNCTIDGGETILPFGSEIILNYNNVPIAYTYNNGTGYYEFLDVPIGFNYTLTLSNFFGTFMTYIDYCPQYIPITTVPSSANNFGFYCPTNDYDYTSFVSMNSFVPGLSRQVIVSTLNYSCSPGIPATVKVILDPLTTYDYSITPSSPVTISGDTVIFQAYNFGFYNFVQNTFHVITSPSAVIGNHICLQAITLPVLGDINPANNNYSYCTPVVSSYDPNNKYVYPAGEGNAGNIAADQELTYTINYQNTGTYYAINIHIDDTLDSDLDINTFRVLGGNNTGYITWPAPNVVRFNYDNIWLPDSSMDLLGSMGHVIYSISPVSGIAIGTQITNSAAIYFDYNAPVITNNTLNTIASPAAVAEIPEINSSFDVYPNPTVNDVNIRINKQGIFSVEILNMTGNVVKTISNIGSGERAVSLSEFGSGIYLVRLLDKNNQTSEFKKIIVQ